MDRDELRGLFPILPQHLIAQEQGDELPATALIHPMSPKSFKAASTIPRLE